MRVYEVIDSKEMFADEINERYFVVYEEILNKNVAVVNNNIFEVSRSVAKTINLLTGDLHSTLQKVKVYPFDQVKLGDIKGIITSDYPEVFIK